MKHSELLDSAFGKEGAEICRMYFSPGEIKEIEAQAWAAARAGVRELLLLAGFQALQIMTGELAPLATIPAGREAEYAKLTASFFETLMAERLKELKEDRE